MNARRGMSLIELMIATGVAAVLSTAALQLFATQARFARLTALQGELQDRARLVRELITHDIMRSGLYWSREGTNAETTNGPFGTGCFGPAAIGASLVSAGGWPVYPFSGTNHTTKADALYLLVPAAGVVAGNGSSGGAYQCQDAGAEMKATAPTAIPDQNFAGWGANDVVVATGPGMVMMTDLKVAAATGNEKIRMNSLAAGECTALGSVTGASLPGRLTVYPVEGVAWVLNGTDLRRCSVRDASAGPASHDTDSTCGDDFTVMRDVEDIQFRYRFARNKVDDSYVPTDFDDCYIDDPTALTTDDNPAVYINLKKDDGSNCNTPGTEYKKRLPEADTTVPFNYPAIRFIGVDVGLVMRSAKQDRQYNDRGQKIEVFDHTPAAGFDNYRRVKYEFRVVAPNAFVF